jgi:hypothetical protein
MTATATSSATEAITYEDLYARWEQSNWRATEIDFAQDARQWREELTEFERRAALWNYALFFWGEDAVTDGLSPYIDAAPREEQKYFLATQQVDEARHAVFFARFMHEVCGLGDGTVGSGLAAIEPQLTWGFRQVFGRLERMTAELRADPSLPRLCAAIALYHIEIEAGLAQSGQAFITSYLEDRDLLPGFRAGMERVAHDEHRHIAFGVKFLADHAAGDERNRRAVAAMLREVSAWSACVLDPPGGDRRYTEVFGSTLEDISEIGVRSLQSKLRAAGMPIEQLPGPSILPAGMTPREVAERSQALRAAGIVGPPGRAIARDEASVALLADTLARRMDPAPAPAGFTVELAFRDAPRHHLARANGSMTARPGAAPGRPSVRLRARHTDFVDVVAGQLHPLKALARGGFVPIGRPADLRRLRAMLG